MSESLMVGMAEVKVTASPNEVLMALGLGSCVGICAFDPTANVAGLAHIVLPDSAGHQGNAGKFADTGIPYLLQQMKQLGASPSRLRVALVGGAQLFGGLGTGAKLDIGPRNAAAVQSVLSMHSITVIAADLGGNIGRTVYLHADGRVTVKTIGRGEEQLTCLGSKLSSEAGAKPRLVTDAPRSAGGFRTAGAASGTGTNPTYLRRACG